MTAYGSVFRYEYSNARFINYITRVCYVILCIRAQSHSTYHFPIRMNMIHTNSTGVGSKSFVQPKITPPFHGNKVTEPLETASNKENCKNVLEGAAINNVQGRKGNLI